VLEPDIRLRLGWVVSTTFAELARQVKLCQRQAFYAVTAEIKTGQRRVISYLLSPLMRYRQEGLRER
jgi:hemolysin D